MGCWNAVCIWRRPNLRLALSLWRTRKQDIEQTLRAATEAVKIAMKIVVAMTGASGAIYTQRLLDNLDPKAHEIHFISTKHAREVGQLELPKGDLKIAPVGDPIRRERVDVCPVRQRIVQI